MRKKFVSLLCGLVLVMGMLAGCGSNADTKSDATADTNSEAGADTPSETEKPLAGRHLVIGINATFAPFEYVDGTDSDGNEVLAGLDVDLVKEMSEILGFTYEFSDMEFNGLIGAIGSGRCDVIVSGISMNEERGEVVDATDPYFMPKIAILSYADNEFKDVASLENHTCGVSLGTVYDTICTDNGKIDVKTYDSTAIAFQDLQNKGIESCMFDATQAQKFIDDNPDLNLVRNILPDSYCVEYEVQGYCVLVPKGDTELLDAFNQAIDELEANGKLNEYIAKWCGEDYISE